MTLLVIGIGMYVLGVVSIIVLGMLLSRHDDD